MAITTDIQNQVFELLSRASNISFVTAEQESGGVSMLTPGQRVSAEVVLMQSNNRAQVKIGNERYNLDLPMAVRTGQTLELTYVASEPRSTFAVARQIGSSPAVALSDASRLLSLLVSSEQIVEPQLRASLQSIGVMLRSSSGESAVLANLLDEVITYSAGLDTSGNGEKLKTASEVGGGTRQNPDQTRLALFESNASQILKNLAQSSRFTLIEAAGQPASPLPLQPGEEINATVVGTLPDGRAFVQITGSTLELLLPQKVNPGEILRLTYISGEPKPTFALSRSVADRPPPLLSEASRWLSVLEHSEGGVSKQQAFVLERLNTVLKSLPADSPVFSAISDEALTYSRSNRPASSEIPFASTAVSFQPQTLSGNGVALSDDMTKLLQAVIKGNRLALLESLNQQSMQTGFTPGQQIKGEVLMSLGGGRFMVQVAEQNLEFVLPKGLSRGDRINLFFITDEPRQTFLLARFGRAGDSTVSDTGRWLSGFLGDTSGKVAVQESFGILRTLLTEPTSDAQLLGRMLQKNLRESGLFYESHLARWFGGEFKLEDILKEPQGRLSPRLAESPGHSQATAEELVRASVRTGSTEIMEAVFNKAGSSMAHEGIADQRSLKIVAEQLSTLQNSQIMLNTELFPGQPMKLAIAERGGERNSSGEREKSWETGISITLPKLGLVTALLTMDSRGIAVKVNAVKGETVPLMEAGREKLIEQLEAVGLTPIAVDFLHDAP